MREIHNGFGYDATSADKVVQKDQIIATFGAMLRCQLNVTILTISASLSLHPGHVPRPSVELLCSPLRNQLGRRVSFSSTRLVRKVTVSCLALQQLKIGHFPQVNATTIPSLVINATKFPAFELSDYVQSFRNIIYVSHFFEELPA